MSDRPRRRSDEPPAHDEPAAAEASANASTNVSAREVEREAGPASVDGPERRSYERFDVTWAVDCQTEDTFLYAWIANISAMGIFVRTTEPLPVGTRVTLRFSPPDDPTIDPLAVFEPGPFVLAGVVQWVNPLRPLHDNPNPGMGIAFVNLTLEDRERLVQVIHTIAYLRDSVPN